ncbi:hypothetical protein ACOMHN_054737 [Nucella lapillus]
MDVCGQSGSGRGGGGPCWLPEGYGWMSVDSLVQGGEGGGPCWLPEGYGWMSVDSLVQGGEGGDPVGYQKDMDGCLWTVWFREGRGGDPVGYQKDMDGCLWTVWFREGRGGTLLVTRRIWMDVCGQSGSGRGGDPVGYQKDMDGCLDSLVQGGGGDPVGYQKDMDGCLWTVWFREGRGGDPVGYQKDMDGCLWTVWFREGRGGPCWLPEGYGWMSVDSLVQGGGEGPCWLPEGYGWMSVDSLVQGGGGTLLVTRRIWMDVCGQSGSGRGGGTLLVTRRIWMDVCGQSGSGRGGGGDPVGYQKDMDGCLWTVWFREGRRGGPCWLPEGYGWMSVDSLVQGGAEGGTLLVTRRIWMDVCGQSGSGRGGGGDPVGYQKDMDGCLWTVWFREGRRGGPCWLPEGYGWMSVDSLVQGGAEGGTLLVTRRIWMDVCGQSGSGRGGGGDPVGYQKDMDGCLWTVWFREGRRGGPCWLPEGYGWMSVDSLVQRGAEGGGGGIPFHPFTALGHLLIKTVETL